MLPQKRRILKSDFGYILSAGKRFNSPHLLLYIAKLKENMAQDSRFSFSVSKKVKPGAVERNKLRRQGYAVVKSHLEKIKPGYFFFFSFKKIAGSFKYTDIEKEVYELLCTGGVVL